MRAVVHVRGELALAQAMAERAKQRVAVLQILDVCGQMSERSWQRALVALKEAFDARFAAEEREDIWEAAMRRARGAS